MKRADFSNWKEISLEEISVPKEELTEEDWKSIHYCDLADSQL
jgi:hypothetical protein